MLRMYSASNPLRTVIEHGLGEFEVGQLTRVFPNGEHRSIKEEIDQRVAELKKDEAQRKATAITWCEKLLGWLRPISVCLRAEDGYLSACAGHSSQSLDPESHRSSYNDRDDSKVYSRASQQPMMMQHAPNKKNSHRAVPAEGSNIVSAYRHVIARLSLLLFFSQDLQLPRVPCRFLTIRPTHRQLGMASFSRTPITHGHASSPFIADPHLNTNHHLSCARIPSLQETLFYGRERKIEAVIGSLNYLIAWHEEVAGIEIPRHEGSEQMPAGETHTSLLFGVDFVWRGRTGGCMARYRVVESDAVRPGDR